MSRGFSKARTVRTPIYGERHGKVKAAKPKARGLAAVPERRYNADAIVVAPTPKPAANENHVPHFLRDVYTRSGWGRRNDG